MSRSQYEKIQSGTPTEKEPSYIIRSLCILFSEFCERLAFYSIAGNLLILFVTLLDQPVTTSNTIVFLFTGTCYLTPIIGAYIADAFLGRYMTIIVFIFIYVIGMVGLGVSVQWFPNVYVVVASLFTVALGTGGIKSNVSPFGADQFKSHPNAVALTQSFFNWFYFAINVGALLAFTVMVIIQQNVSFGLGFLIAAGVMLLSSLFFVLGSGTYEKTKPAGSIMSTVFGILFFSCFAKEEVKEFSHGFFDRAKAAQDREGDRKYTNEQVEDVSVFVRVLPIMITFILYWTLYFQMSTAFLTQGLVLNLIIGKGNFILPAAVLNLFDTIGILTLVPIFERILYPLFDKFGIKFGVLKRIGAGLVLISIAMIAAASLESYRLLLVNNGDTQIQRVTQTQTNIASTLSIWWQVPQYLLIGASEVLASISGLEFAYDQAPSSMKSMVMAVFLFTSAIGSYMGSVVLNLTNYLSEALGDGRWITENINSSRYDLYFLLLAGLGFLNFFLFVAISKCYKFRNTESKLDINN